MLLLLRELGLGPGRRCYWEVSRGSPSPGPSCALLPTPLYLTAFSAPPALCLHRPEPLHSSLVASSPWVSVALTLPLFLLPCVSRALRFSLSVSLVSSSLSPVLFLFPFSTPFLSALLILTSLFLPLFSPPLQLSHAPAFPCFSCLHPPQPSASSCPHHLFPSPQTHPAPLQPPHWKKRISSADPVLALPPPQSGFPPLLTPLWFPRHPAKAAASLFGHSPLSHLPLPGRVGTDGDFRESSRKGCGYGDPGHCCGRWGSPFRWSRHRQADTMTTARSRSPPSPKLPPYR